MNILSNLSSFFSSAFKWVAGNSAAVSADVAEGLAVLQSFGFVHNHIATVVTDAANVLTTVAANNQGGQLTALQQIAAVVPVLEKTAADAGIHSSVLNDVNRVTPALNALVKITTAVQNGTHLPAAA